MEYAIRTLRDRWWFEWLGTFKGYNIFDIWFFPKGNFR